MKIRTIALPLALAAAASLQACVINADSHTQRSGKFVSASTLAQVEPGRNGDYVLAVLGEPSSKTALSDGAEIWKWTYREKRNSSGAVFLLIDADSTTETESSTYVELKDGVVVRSWQD